MANKTQEAQSAKLEPTPTQDVIVVSEKELTTRLFAKSANKTLSYFVQETSQYLNLEQGETYKLAFKGITEMVSTMPDNAGEIIEVASFENEQGLAFVNGDSIVVSTCKKVLAAGHAPCLLVIYVRGEIKSKTGRKYKDLQIFRMP